MEKLPKLIKILLFISFFLGRVTFANVQFDPETLKKIEKAIVGIESRIAVSAYQDAGSWTGTGFITDKANGFIITNTHIIGAGSIGTYFVTFYNGRQVQAKPIYYDLWQDYAVLQVMPQEMPNSAEQIAFSKTMAHQGESVFVIGNPEGQEFSFHTGYISSLYEITGVMPQSSYIVNLNSAGGASGSPLLNDKNEAVGVVYGGSKTYALALHGEYVQKTLNALKNNKAAIRKHMGVLCELYSLDKAMRHRHFLRKEMEGYIKNFPDARNKVVAVRSIIAGSPAENILQPGDIIWAVNGQELGGDLAVLDIAMDSTNEDSIKLKIYRDGKKLEQIVKLYNVNSNKIERMVNFGGATFFEADDIVSAKSGIPLKSLAVRNVQTGSSFSSIPVNYNQDYKNLYRLEVKSINENKVTSLGDLIKVIPQTIEQKFASIRFKNYQLYFPSFQANSFISAQEDLIIDITFDSIDTKPRILKFDPAVKDWISEDIIE